MTVPVNPKPNVFYVSKEHIAVITGTDTLADGFYGTVIINSAVPVVVTIGSAANNDEKTIKFVNIGAGSATVSDGSTIMTLSTGIACSIVSDGTAWRIVSHTDFEASGAVSAHSSINVDDSGGVHGFETDTPTVTEDGKALIWDNTAGKHIYGAAGNFTETTAPMELYVDYFDPLTGTADATGTTVTGTGTAFMSELAEGDMVILQNGVDPPEYRLVDSITDDDEFIVDTVLLYAYDDITVYVAVAGDDSNDGSAPDAGHALATIQEAIDRIPDLIKHEVNVYFCSNLHDAENIEVGNKHIITGPIAIRGPYTGVDTVPYVSINTLLVYNIYGIVGAYDGGIYFVGTRIKGDTQILNVTECGLDSIKFDTNATPGGKGVLFKGGLLSLYDCEIDGSETGIYVYSGEVVPYEVVIKNCTLCGVYMAGGIFNSVEVTMSGNATNYDTSYGGLVLPIPLSWAEYAAQWTTAPAFVETIAAGDVYEYDMDGTSIYRLVPSPYVAANDAFYTTFSTPNLSDLIVARG